MRTNWNVIVGSRVTVRETGFANPLCCKTVEGGNRILPAGVCFNVTVTKSVNDPECGQRCVGKVKEVEAFKTHGAKDDQIFFPANSVIGIW